MKKNPVFLTRNSLDRILKVDIVNLFAIDGDSSVKKFGIKLDAKASYTLEIHCEEDSYTFGIEILGKNGYAQDVRFKGGGNLQLKNQSDIYLKLTQLVDRTNSDITSYAIIIKEVKLPQENRDCRKIIKNLQICKREKKKNLHENNVLKKEFRKTNHSTSNSKPYIDKKSRQKTSYLKSGKIDEESIGKNLSSKPLVISQDQTTTNASVYNNYEILHSTSTLSPISKTKQNHDKDGRASQNNDSHLKSTKFTKGYLKRRRFKVRKFLRSLMTIPRVCRRGRQFLPVLLPFEWYQAIMAPFSEAPKYLDNYYLFVQKFTRPTAIEPKQYCKRLKDNVP